GSDWPPANGGGDGDGWDAGGSTGLGSWSAVPASELGPSSSDAAAPRSAGDDGGDSGNYHEGDQANEAAKFYDGLTRDLGTRADSRLYHMRNFNGWVKATQIAELDPDTTGAPVPAGGRRRGRRAPLRVLDLACGKGGDLTKWTLHGRGLENYVGVDVARGSLMDAAKRARDMSRRGDGTTLGGAQPAVVEHPVGKPGGQDVGPAVRPGRGGRDLRVRPVRRRVHPVRHTLHDVVQGEGASVLPHGLEPPRGGGEPDRHDDRREGRRGEAHGPRGRPEVRRARPARGHRQGRDRGGRRGQAAEGRRRRRRRRGRGRLRGQRRVPPPFPRLHAPPDLPPGRHPRLRLRTQVLLHPLRGRRPRRRGGRRRRPSRVARAGPRPRGAGGGGRHGVGGRVELPRFLRRPVRPGAAPERSQRALQHERPEQVGERERGGVGGQRDVRRAQVQEGEGAVASAGGGCGSGEGDMLLNFELVTPSRESPRGQRQRKCDGAKAVCGTVDGFVIMMMMPAA
ncbi:hypothetical protein THAOC_33571, partial [Thalassiosira oceanica]